MTGIQLKKIRERMELSQAEMAKRVGCLVRYYIYRESGEKEISKMMENSILYIAQKGK